MPPHFPFFLFIFISFSTIVTSQLFPCPQRCQCYEDNEQRQQVHLVCKWEQLNTTSLRLARPDLVRTLTIRCPFHSPKVSTPPPALFQGFRNLDRLEIDRCKIDSLPEGLFAGLHQLYSLILKNSNISDLPREIFAHVPNLMTLDLSGNLLRIEPYSLRSLENLIHLDLSDNQIGFLTNTLISLTKLKVITMNNNRITNIDFRRFPENLTDLSIRHNLISTIHYLPSSARALKRLDLAGNRLEFLAGSLTGNMNVLPAELKHVDLSENRINYIQDSALNHLHHLVLLDLKNNSLKEVKSIIFRGSQNQMKVFLSENPITCHCNHRWIIKPGQNMNVTIADLHAVQCVDLLNPEKKMLLTLAESRNNLLCKYANMCEADCSCCDKMECKCRFECPPSCKCLRSADTSSPRTSQNVIVCDNLRLDKLEILPSPLTQLHLNNTDWRVFQIDNLAKLPFLRNLKISNSKMTSEEMQRLVELKNLTHLEISGSSLNSIPSILSEMSSLTHLNIQDNPLLELNSQSLMALDTMKKIKLGGNFSQFACDCESPSDFQRWLLKKSNRAKIDDLDEIYCDLNQHGIVMMVESLPGTNESVCIDPTEETKQWMNFVENAKKSMMDQKESKGDAGSETNSTSSSPEAKKTEMMSTLIKLENEKPEKLSTSTELAMTTRKSTSQPTSSIITTSASTTVQYRKKFKEIEDPHKFVNVLTFILFICVIILIISIGVTVYLKFFRPEETMFKRKKKASSMREEQPLQNLENNS